MTTKLLATLVFGVMAAVPLSAAAATSLALDFKGTVSPASSGDVFIYNPFDNEITSFDAQPVDLSMTIMDDVNGPYVSTFALTWSNQTYALPYITSWSGTGFSNDPAYIYAIGNQSTVNVGSSGGSIAIGSTLGYDAAYDGGIEFSVNYALSSPHGSSASFTDNGVVGGGRIEASVNQSYDPSIGEYDAQSYLHFTLTSVSQVASGAPEPTEWALLALGFGAVGTVARRRTRTSQTIGKAQALSSGS
jgi:hypothetical protein